MPSSQKLLYTEEHELVRKMAYDFTRNEVMPIIAEHDRKHTFPSELLPKMAQLGFLGICLPARYGGAGMDFLSLGIVCEALEYGDSSVRETIAVHLALHALPIFQWGTEEQKQAFLPDLACGAHVACFGLTEPGAGSDVAAIQTRARRDGDDYLLSGEKMWITLADVSSSPRRSRSKARAASRPSFWSAAGTGFPPARSKAKWASAPAIPAGSICRRCACRPLTGWGKRARASRSR